MLPAEGTASSKTLGIHKGQQARARVIREKIRDQVLVSPRENSGSSVIGMRSLLDRRGVRSGLHFRRIPPMAGDTDGTEGRIATRRLQQ